MAININTVTLKLTKI